MHITRGCMQLIDPVLDFRVSMFLAESLYSGFVKIGLRNTLTCIRENNASAVILATDIGERTCADPKYHSQDLLHDIVREATARHVPIIYALNRRHLARALRCSGPRTCAVTITTHIDDDRTTLGDKYTHLLILAARARVMFLKDAASLLVSTM